MPRTLTTLMIKGGSVDSCALRFVKWKGCTMTKAEIELQKNKGAVGDLCPFFRYTRRGISPLLLAQRKGK